VTAKVVRNQMVPLHVDCGMMMWDGQPSNHTFRLLFKHGVSPCSATQRKCQMKQMRWRS